MAEHQGIHRAVGGGEQCWPGDDMAGPDHHCVEWQANARVATAQFLDFHAAAARSHQALADQALNARCIQLQIHPYPRIASQMSFSDSVIRITRNSLVNARSLIRPLSRSPNIVPTTPPMHTGRRSGAEARAETPHT